MPDKSDRRIFLGMPGYAKQTGGAGEGFWCACKDDTHLTRDGEKNGSLLAANFNALWCAALNIVNKGGRVDYFAMLHNDIGPGKYWLDKLIDELEEKQLDVLGVAVPIKDGRGLTSLALHDEENNWRVGCRLTMHDIFQLPETFTSSDLEGKKLLLNTGCWVCKFDMAWATKVHFEINDRIIYEKSTNEYLAENESEDWFFSRMLHEIGEPGSDTSDLKPLRIGATRKIEVAHRGECDFLNNHQWGYHPVDYERVQVSPVPGAFPRDIPGWLFEDEGKALAELARGKRVLEIGSYCGLSTVCMARTAKHVVAVDFFDGRGTPVDKDTRTTFDIGIARHGVKDKITVIHPDAEIPMPEFDFAFIDASHDIESVELDIEKACSVLKPGGLLAFHDYMKRTDPGVTKAVQNFVDNGAEIISVTNTLAVVRPPAQIPLEV